METLKMSDAPASTRDPLTGQPPGSVIETKEFLRTSEFWLTVVTMFGVMIAGLALNALDSPRVSLLVTILAVGYTVSRGIAKAGNAHPFWGRELPMMDRDGEDDRDIDQRDDLIVALQRIESRIDRLERTRPPSQVTL